MLKLWKKRPRNVSEEKPQSLLCNPEPKNLNSRPSQTLFGKMKKIHNMSPCPQNHSTFTTDKNNNWNYWRTYFGFQSAGLLVVWFFFQAKAGQPQQGWEIAALRQPLKSHRSSRARSAPWPSRPFPSRLQSTHLKCLYLTSATETLLDQSRTAEPAHRQF